MKNYCHYLINNFILNEYNLICYVATLGPIKRGFNQHRSILSDTLNIIYLITLTQEGYVFIQTLSCPCHLFIYIVTLCNKGCGFNFVDLSFCNEEVRALNNSSTQMQVSLSIFNSPQQILCIFCTEKLIIFLTSGITLNMPNRLTTQSCLMQPDNN